jgi:hypothetical protein
LIVDLLEKVMVFVNTMEDVDARKTPQLERKGEEKERERESFTEILSFLERFSPPVEIQYIFYRALSLQKGENLSTFEFLSVLSLSFSLPPQILSN